MIINSPEDFTIGSKHTEVITDSECNDHKVVFIVKRKTTFEEWKEYAKSVGVKLENTIPQYSNGFYFEILTD